MCATTKTSVSALLRSSPRSFLASYELIGFVIRPLFYTQKAVPVFHMRLKSQAQRAVSRTFRRSLRDHENTTPISVVGKRCPHCCFFVFLYFFELVSFSSISVLLLRVSTACFSHFPIRQWKRPAYDGTLQPTDNCEEWAKLWFAWKSSQNYSTENYNENHK